jgi:predicted transcriptional regulator YheO
VNTPSKRKSRRVHSKLPSFGTETYLVSELQRIADGVNATVGDGLCECVIHDFREPVHSIIWIRGNVTRRTTGGTMSQIGLAMMAEGDNAKDMINYITRTRDGKILKSSTLALRDADGHVFGCFCINLDITSLAAVEKTLRNFLSGEETQVLSNIQFTNNIADVFQVMIDEAIQQIGLSGPLLDVSQRQELVRMLDQRGFFGIRRSTPVLADYLGVSRVTIYNYLNEVRARPSDAL